MAATVKGIERVFVRTAGAYLGSGNPPFIVSGKAYRRVPFWPVNVVAARPDGVRPPPTIP